MNSSGASDTGNQQHLQFHFIKSNFFRVIHVDGAWGGISPNGYIQFSVFSQRQPIPQVVEDSVKVDGASAKKIEEASKTGKSGIVREVEANLVMSLETAESIHKWLGGHIEKLKAMRSQKGGN